MANRRRPRAHANLYGTIQIDMDTQALLRALVASTEAADIWTLQSGIFPENVASLALRARAGFRTIGVRRQIESALWA